MKKGLEKYLRNKAIIDIFLFGSSIKEKEKPGDIDLIVFFKEKNYRVTEEIIYAIKKTLNMEHIHIEPLFLDGLFKGSLFSSLLHEGISIRYGKSLNELAGYHPFLLFTFSLQHLKKVEKVRFAQTLYGRKKGKGILHEEGGISLGKGTFLIPVYKEHLFRDLMKQSHVSFTLRRVLVKD